MPSPAPLPVRRASATRLRRALAASARAHDGFTLIEVLASAFVVVLFALGTLMALDVTTRESFQTRLHTDAQALAQQDEARLRGLSVDELANLDKTLPAVTLDGVQFTVREQATFVGDTTQTASCSRPATDYLKTSSTVTWSNIGASSPVVNSSIITPPVAETGQGGLAVTVDGADGSGIGGMTVSISGPSSSSLLTDANGCALFGDLTPGSYTIDVYSYGPTFVDGSTGAAVTTSTPDVTTQGVVAGSIAGQSLNLAPPGALSLSFVSTSGNPVGVAPGAVGVSLYNSTLGGNQLRVCTLNNGTSCPPVSGADTAFGTADWPQLAGANQITATPLYPLTSAYSVYAGTCTANEPAKNGGTDVTAMVTSNATTTVPPLTVPAMVIHVYSGKTTTSGELLPNDVYIKDTGCNVRYYGYVPSGGSDSATTPLKVSTGANPEQANLPLNPNYPSSTTGGLLDYPGMPYGTYNICVDNGTNSSKSNFWAVTGYANNNSPAVVNVFEGNTATGTVSGELSTC